jgi:hypothetical protein
MEALELLEQVRRGILANPALRAAMASVKRWHAYYEDEAPPPFRDCNGYGHALNTHGIVHRHTAIDCRAGLISPLQAVQLRTTALIHDLGEIEAGDVPYGGRSETQQSREMASFQANLPHFFPKLTPAQRQQVERLYIEVAMEKGETDVRAHYFHMVEITGYSTFGLEIFRDRPKDFEWEALGWRIVNYHFFNGKRDLPLYAQEFPSVKAWTHRRLGCIDRMVQHYSQMDQAAFLAGPYQRCARLPDLHRVKPIDFSVWPELRAKLNGLN